MWWLFLFCTSKNNGSIIYVYLIYNNYIWRNNSGTQYIVIGFETASQLYLDKINSGCTMEELKEFIENNLKNKDVIEKVANGKTVND